MDNNRNPKSCAKVEHVSDIVGEWGNWQRISFWFTFCLWIITALNNMGYSFYALEDEFWCRDVPEEHRNESSQWKCHQYQSTNQSCTEWHYSSAKMSRTIISEFNLVCDKAHLASLTQSCYMWGYLISGLLFGYLSDKYGRRPMIWLSVGIEVIALSFSALSTHITQYLISRLLIGIGSCGRTCAMRTLLVECCGTKYRSDIITGTSIGWIVGYVALPLLAYVLRDFRLMHWFSVALFILMLIWFAFLWESPRWLITNGHIDRARDTLKRAIRMNKMDMDNFDDKFDQLIAHLRKSSEDDTKNKAKVNVLDLFRTPHMRRYSLILNYISVIIAFVYYGFSLNMSDFGGNFYVTFVLSGLVELPAVAAVLLMVRLIGRRYSFFGSLIVVTIACLAVIPFSSNSWLTVALALVGKTSVTTAWCVLDIYSPEIFPTVLRNTGLAILLTIGRLGSSSAPFMKNMAADFGLSVVMIFYSVITCLAAVSTLYLPETKGREIPDSVEEAENASK